MTKKTEMSVANEVWLDILDKLIEKGKQRQVFCEDIHYTVPMNDPMVTFFHADPTYYAYILCNSQTFLRGFGDVPRQLMNVVAFLEKCGSHPNATVYIHGAPYTEIKFALTEGKLQCLVKLSAVDVWRDLPTRTTELAVMSAFVCMGLRKLGLKVGLGDIDLSIGQAYLSRDRQGAAVAALWASDISSHHMGRFPEAPITMDELIHGVTSGNNWDLIHSVNFYKDVFSQCLQ